MHATKSAGQRARPSVRPSVPSFRISTNLSRCLGYHEVGVDIVSERRQAVGRGTRSISFAGQPEVEVLLAELALEKLAEQASTVCNISNQVMQRSTTVIPTGARRPLARWLYPPRPALPRARMPGCFYTVLIQKTDGQEGTLFGRSNSDWEFGIGNTWSGRQPAAP